MFKKNLLLASIAIFVAGCGTYYDPGPYTTGLRFYDRGMYGMARDAWEPLVQQGDCDAEFRLGVLYFLEQGVQRDVSKALDLWEKAANQGQPRAQYALGDIYFMDANSTRFFCRFGCEGIGKNLPEAYKWYLLSQRSAVYDNDKKYLASVIPKIKQAMTPEQAAIGEQAANGWKPAPAACKPRKLL